MPQFLKDQLIVTAEELVPAFYASIASLSTVVARDAERGFGLKRVVDEADRRRLLLLYDSLKQDAKKVLPDPRKGQCLMEKHYRVDTDAVEFFKNNGYTDDATARQRVINASCLWACLWLKAEHVAAKVRLGGKVKDSEISQMVADELQTFGRVLLERTGETHTLPTEYRNLRDKMKKFEEERYQCLIHGLAGRQSNGRKRDEYAEMVIRSMFAGTGRKPNYTELEGQWNAFVDGYVEVVNRETGEVYDNAGCKKMSRSTIYGFLKQWDERIAVAHARGGDRQKLMGEYTTSHKLDIPEWAGSIVSVDDRQPPFEYAQGKRMWFYMALDAASCCITTWVWGKDKESMIVEFYRQMVRNHAEWGISLPAELEAESNLNSSFKDTFLKPGQMFQHVRIEANNARGKFIESRLNRVMRYHSALEKGDTGWIGRPFARDESNQMGPEKLPRVPYDQLVERCLANIETFNNMPHKTEKGMSRWDYFIKKQNPKLKPINWRGILPGLGHCTTTSVRAGELRLNNSVMLLGVDGRVATGEKLIDALTEIDGKEVTAYWLDGNDGQVLKALVYIGDRYICEAVAKPHYNRAKVEQTEADEEARTLMSAYVATIEGYRRRKMKTIEKVEVIDNRKVTVNNNFSITKKRATTEREPAEVLEDVTHEDVMEYEVESFVRPKRERY